MKTLNIFLIIILNTFIIYGQHKEEVITLEKLEIKNEIISNRLQEIIINEKRCDYYSDDLIFIIYLERPLEGVSIYIETNNDKNTVFNSRLTGFFYLKKHLFLIEGEDNLLSNLFVRTGIKEKFNYIDYDISYEEYSVNGERILRVILDDYLSRWKILYSSGNFLLENESTYCE